MRLRLKNRLDNFAGTKSHSFLVVGSALLFGLAGVATLAFSRADTIYSIPSTIASDCSKDVSGEINTWLAGVPNGTATNPSVVQFASGACYRVDAGTGTQYGTTTPALQNRQYLVLDGNGAKLDMSFVPASNYTLANHAVIAVAGGQNITVRNFVIKGDHTNPCNLDVNGRCRDGGSDDHYEWHHGIGFFGTASALAENNKINDVYGDGVSLANGGAGQPQIGNGAIVRNNVIDGTGRMAVGLTAFNNVTIANNTFDRISYHGIDIEHEIPGTTSTNVTITGNTLKRHYLGFVSAETGECVERKNYTITNNTMEVGGVTTFPPLSFRRAADCAATYDGLTVSGNTIIRTDGSGGPPASDNASLFITGWNNVTVASNRFSQVNTVAAPIQLNGITPSATHIRSNDMRENAGAYAVGGVNNVPGIDACGNITSAGSSTPVACSSSDTSAPSVTITNPGSGSTLTGTVTVTASATDNVGVNKVEFYVDNQLAATGPNQSFNWATGAVANGTHTLLAKAYDAANNVGASTVVSVTVKNAVISNPVDTTAPQVAISSPSGGSTVSGSNVRLTAKATDNIEVTSLTFVIDGATYASSASGDLTTTWNTKPKKISAGAHVITAIAKDAAGNTTSTSVTITVKK